MPGVTTYGADGLRKRNHSLKTVLYMESRKTAILHRTRKEVVVRAQLCRENSILVRTHVKAGTRYSYLEQIGGHRGWAHSRLPQIPVARAQGLTNHEFAAEVDYERRLAFRAVQVSIRK